MKPLPLRVSLTALFTVLLALLVTALTLAYHAILVRQLDAAATSGLEEMARALHGYLQFQHGMPVLVYDRDDAGAAAFVDDATDYYQVYNAQDGRLLTQSPGLRSLGLHFAPGEVAEFLARPVPRDVRTERGRLRLMSTVISPAPGEVYLVQVGELLGGVDKALATFDRLLFWRIAAGLVLAAGAGWWLAGRALKPLSRMALEARAIDITNLHDRLPVRGVDDELGEVARAFNDALARVEHAVGEMRQFSTALAHELRTPLAILRGEAELALRPSASDADRRQALAKQVEEYDRLTRLITQILTLARAESGDIRMARGLVDVTALAAAVADQIELVAASQGITLTCDSMSDAKVLGDAGWLERLLLILLDNAIKFTDDGGHVELAVRRSETEVVVTVTDSGPGISPSVLPHVFDRFYQADPRPGRATQGAGLGLALAKWVAGRHGGTIEVTSRLGEGTTFTVRLRRADGAGRGAADLGARHQQRVEDHRGVRRSA